MTTTSKWASRAARSSALIVAAGAAALSFRATADVAEASGAVQPGWGWVVPLVVEAGVLTAAALAWIRTGEGTQARTELIVMGALLSLSVVVNVSHANGTVLGKVLAAVPPVVLLVAVEGLLREQRRTAARDLSAAVVPAVVESADRWPARQPEVQPEQWAAAVVQPLLVPEPEPEPMAVTTVADLEPIATEREVRSEPVESPLAADLDQVEPELERELVSADEGVFGPTKSDLAVSAQARPRSDEDLANRVRTALRRGEAVTGQTIADWLEVSGRTGQRRLKRLTDADPELLQLIDA